LGEAYNLYKIEFSGEVSLESPFETAAEYELISNQNGNKYLSLNKAIQNDRKPF
jgi:hypothetical protein